MWLDEKIRLKIGTEFEMEQFRQHVQCGGTPDGTWLRYQPVFAMRDDDLTVWIKRGPIDRRGKSPIFKGRIVASEKVFYVDGVAGFGIVEKVVLAILAAGFAGWCFPILFDAKSVGDPVDDIVVPLFFLFCFTVAYISTRRDIEFIRRCLMEAVLVSQTRTLDSPATEN